MTDLRRLLDEATPRPWVAEFSGPTGPVVMDAESTNALDHVAKCPHYRGAIDAQLIAAAVNALPDLLDADENQDILIGSVNHYKADRDAIAAKLDAAESALARVRELHERWPIHGDGDHPEDCDCGDPWVTVCRLCCTDGEDQHETCAVHHDHGPDKPICPTIAAMGGEQS